MHKHVEFLQIWLNKTLNEWFIVKKCKVYQLMSRWLQLDKGVNLSNYNMLNEVKRDTIYQLQYNPPHLTTNNSDHVCI